MKKFLVFTFLILLCGCASIKPLPETGNQEYLQQLWNDAHSNSPDAKPFRVQLSLRFGSEGDTRRVTGILWGNSADDLRLDVLAGVGAVIASIKDDQGRFLMFVPQEQHAYFHEGPTKPLLKIGTPLPVDMTRLANLINGNFGAVFGEYFQSAYSDKNGNGVYTLSEDIGGILTITPSGLPLLWQHDKWKMEFAYKDAEKLPHRLSMYGKNGKKAILLIKEREFLNNSFSVKELKLDIPEDIKIEPLPQNK